MKKYHVDDYIEDLQFFREIMFALLELDYSLQILLKV